MAVVVTNLARTVAQRGREASALSCEHERAKDAASLGITTQQLVHVWLLPDDIRNRFGLLDDLFCRGHALDDIFRGQNLDTG